PITPCQLYQSSGKPCSSTTGGPDSGPATTTWSATSPVSTRRESRGWPRRASAIATSSTGARSPERHAAQPRPASAIATTMIQRGQVMVASGPQHTPIRQACSGLGQEPSGKRAKPALPVLARVLHNGSRGGNNPMRWLPMVLLAGGSLLAG